MPGLGVLSALSSSGRRPGVLSLTSPLSSTCPYFPRFSRRSSFQRRTRNRRLTPHCSGLGVSRWRSFLLAAKLDIVRRRFQNSVRLIASAARLLAIAFEVAAVVWLFVF